MELKDKGITVTAVCPGWMKTGFYNRANIGAAKGITHFTAIRTPDKVAKKALRDAKKGKDVSVSGVYARLEHTVVKILPQRIVMKLWVWLQRIK